MDVPPPLAHVTSKQLVGDGQWDGMDCQALGTGGVQAGYGVWFR